MDHEQIQQLFPVFQEISDSQLRQQSIHAMSLAMEQGGWDLHSIERCPVTLNWKNSDISWVEHVRDVTQMCMLELGVLGKYYARHHVPLNRDIVIAGALLHDIGKLTEFTLRDDAITHGPDFQLMRHPLSGALIAAQAGLPNQLIHLIATHSFEGDNSYHTPESAFVRAIDMFTFTCCVKGLEKI